MEVDLNCYFEQGPESKCGKIIIFTRRHWVSFSSKTIMAIVIFLLPLALYFLIHSVRPTAVSGYATNVLVIAFSVYYLLLFRFTLMAWISYYYDLYLVNDDNIIDVTQNGIFDRKIAQLSLLRVQDVSSSVKGILPTIFNYGDVLVETAGEKEDFILEAVPNPQAFVTKILELHDGLIAHQGRSGQLAEGEGTMRPGNPLVNPAIVNSVPAVGATNEIISPIPNNPSSQVNIPSTSTNEGEITKDDLNQGGEVKL